jgi:hypothetical protein
MLIRQKGALALDVALDGSFSNEGGRNILCRISRIGR